MKAVQLSAIGQPLVDVEIASPRPLAGEVLVDIHAAGICHSDAHYQSGIGSTGPLPLTLGHEIAGVVAEVGADVSAVAVGDRVAIHYLVSCRTCAHCVSGNEQFCRSVAMAGKERAGGYAEQIVVPQRNCVVLPQAIPFDQAAVMMCACATALHGINKVRVIAGETLAIFGIGGLGTAAVQIAIAKGAAKVIAIDLVQEKIEWAQTFGAIGINASSSNVIDEIMKLTDDRGVDSGLELTGSPVAMRQAIDCLAPKGRLALVGISDSSIDLNPYRDLIQREADVIGVSDHTLDELSDLIRLVENGDLDVGALIDQKVRLEADAINSVLTTLAENRAPIRSVIKVR